MFEASRLGPAPSGGLLVFLSTDHGFNLAFDPAPGASSVIARRYHGDALDRLAWEALGRPPSVRYELDIRESPGVSVPHVVPLAFPDVGPVVIEGESLWPPRAQTGGWALPEWASGTCASASRWLGVHIADGEARASISLALPGQLLAGHRIVPRVALRGAAQGRIILRAAGRVQQAEEFSSSVGSGLDCILLRPLGVPREALAIELILERNAKGGLPTGSTPLMALDALVVEEQKNH
jgi:hypothetical protein